MAEMTIHSPVQSRPKPTNWRRVGQSLMGHTVVAIVGLFFIIPIVWMFFTAFKTDQDTFRFPATLLPHDNLKVMVNGQELPLYNVPVEEGPTRQLALLKVGEGQGTFIDPANPTAEAIKARMRKVAHTLNRIDDGVLR